MTGMKPCRWCRSEKVTLHHNPFWNESFVICRCGARGPKRDTPSAAINAWNTRDDDWLPIDTAPKDGTEVVLFVPTYMENPVAVYRYEIDTVSGGIWNGIDGWMYADQSGEDAPTHWRPLPAPPETTDG